MRLTDFTRRAIVWPLKYLIVQPFLVFTTMWPIVMLMNFWGMDSGVMNAYRATLGFLVEHLFQTTFEDFTFAQFVTLFYLIVFLISFLVKFTLQQLNKKTEIKFKHIVGLVSLIYLIAVGSAFFSQYLSEAYDSTAAWFTLTFYLFNLFSLFATIVIRRFENDDESKINLLKERMG